MAEKTKDSNLSIEERLEQTVVPNWDYPYIIPQNWVFFWFTKLIDIEGGTQPPKSQFVDCELDGYVRLVQIRDFSSDKYIVFVPDSNKLRHFNENDILIARYGASLGKICTGLKGVYNVALAKTIFSEEVLNRKYVYWMLHSESFQNPLMTISRTAQAGFNKDDLSRFAMPLPPLAEQQRIVEHIESLFEKLDEAKEKAQGVVDGFETRKAAILHKAFSGELTEKWREELGIKLNCWKPTILQDVCEKIVCGKTPTGYITEHGEVPFLKVYNIVDNQIDFNTTPQFIPQSIHCGKLKSSTLKPNDVIMNIVGPPLRKIAIIPDTYPEWNMNQAIVRFRPTEKLNHKFLYYALINPETLDDVIAATKGVVGQANISVSQSRSLTINIPSWDEQIEIVRILDYIINKEICVKNAAIAVIEQINIMKKAILVRAFRGELGTNDPSEESAIELLKQVLAEDVVVQAPAKKPAKRISIPSNLKDLLSNVREEEIIKLLLKTAPQPVLIQEIMSLSSKKFELMDALRSLEKKKLITKNESGKYLLTR